MLLCEALILYYNPFWNPFYKKNLNLSKGVPRGQSYQEIHLQFKSRDCLNLSKFSNVQIFEFLKFLALLGSFQCVVNKEYTWCAILHRCLWTRNTTSMQKCLQWPFWVKQMAYQHQIWETQWKLAHPSPLLGSRSLIGSSGFQRIRETIEKWNNLKKNYNIISEVLF